MNINESDDSDIENDGNNRNDGYNGYDGNNQGGGMGNDFDIFALNNMSMGGNLGTNINKYNMGFGAGFDSSGNHGDGDEDENGSGNEKNNNNDNNDMDHRINELQERAKDGVEKLVDNKAYTKSNPSMGKIQHMFLYV